MMTIAFVGNPNTGKTALINAIAGSDLQVGNWPGVTVEKKEVTFDYEGESIHFIDLPGAYTLSPYTIEEKVTRRFLATAKVDGLVNVVDTTNLRRNLYLTLELIDMQLPMVLALNMFDDFTKRGYDLRLDRLEAILGIACVPTIASRGAGVKRLVAEAVAAVKERRIPHIQPYQEHLEKEIALLVHKMAGHEEIRSPRYLAIRLIEGDALAVGRAKEWGLKRLVADAAEARGRLERHMGLPIATILTRCRYDVIDTLLKEVLVPPLVDRVQLSDRIDRLALHPWFGVPIFVLVMYLMFKFTFDGSSPFVDWMNGFFETFLSPHLRAGMAGMPPWLVSLVTDGIVAGVGLVLSFLPLLLFLYFFMALLEESGYMARVSFLLDRVAAVLGIKGNAFIALIVGFGCNVPAVYATRTLTSRRERIITALMIPLMSCSARLPIYALFTALFFTEHRALIILSLYGLGVTLALLIGFAANRILPLSDAKPFFLELPTYHLPTGRAIWNSMQPKLKDFLVKAGSVIVMASVILWAVINLPPGSTPQTSWLARSAKTVTPLFRPAGFGDHWEPVAALIPGTLAKEVVIGSLGTIYGVETSEKRVAKAPWLTDLAVQVAKLGDAAVEAGRALLNLPIRTLQASEEKSGLRRHLREQFPSPLSAYAYLVFVLLYIPCASTMAALKEELGWRVMLFEVLSLPLLAYGAAVAVYQAGLLFLSH
ncbi:ferrous iron transport protein B [Hydrogenimonas sp. SS33]|uniref:ferrous iron transport protein B n=1 Tax=Hydrogenimonas leucolamina TaxID=2954236 RepID=UPI00336BBBE6